MGRMRVAGVMSGTSADAIDVAICEFHPGDEPDVDNFGLIAYRETPLPGALRARLLGFWQTGVARLDELTELNFELGGAFADAVADAAGDDPLDLIASHGQTIYHLVEPGRHLSTLQMAEPAVLAARTGTTTVADFRVADVAAGGQGAPLVPFFDALFCGGETVRAVQNIGGIANVTFLVPESAPVAFDTGPGNALIDAATRMLFGEPLDRDGRHAAAGRVDRALLNSLLAHQYFVDSPPKSTGREIFGDAMAKDVLDRAHAEGIEPNDILATLTALTAESIARAYRDFGPSQLEEAIVSGGGARNPTLMAMLDAALPDITLRHYDELGIPGTAKEAVAFAVLGREAVLGRVNNLPACTGAARAVIMGKIIPGENYSALMRALFADGRTWEPISKLRFTG